MNALSTTDANVPESIADVEQLEALLSEPNEAAIEAMRQVKGDIIVLGVGGKMGPTLARMAKRAAEAAGTPRRVIGVSRFSSGDLEAELNRHGIETVRCDLLNEEEVAKLPDAPNVIYMAGMKFGSTGKESLTWAMNTYLPAVVAKRYANSRIAAFSTGNIYGLTPSTRGGSIEGDPLNPTGEYAVSCLGRERIFEHFSRTLNIPTAMIRLNYATELRYGVLVDLAQQVWAGHPIDLSMGIMNVIWQADANAMTIASLADADTPPFLLNVAGPEQLSVRRVCEQFGELMGKSVQFVGEESPDALLNNGQLGHRKYGYPRVGAQQMLIWIADWIKRDGDTLGKPTHFEVRDGKF